MTPGPPFCFGEPLAIYNRSASQTTFSAGALTPRGADEAAGNICGANLPGVNSRSSNSRVPKFELKARETWIRTEHPTVPNPDRYAGQRGDHPAAGETGIQREGGNQRIAHSPLPGEGARGTRAGEGSLSFGLPWLVLPTKMGRPLGGAPRPKAPALSGNIYQENASNAFQPG